jgi:hypothetical protein
MKTLPNINYDWHGNESCHATTTFYLILVDSCMRIYEERDAKRSLGESEEEMIDNWEHFGFKVAAKVTVDHLAMVAENWDDYMISVRKQARKAFIDAGVCEVGRLGNLYPVE